MVIISLSGQSYGLTQKIEVLGMVCAFCAQGYREETLERLIMLMMFLLV